VARRPVATLQYGSRQLTPIGPYDRDVPLFQPIIDALNRNDVRYVIVGGLAVVLHGYPRLTADLDLVVDLNPEEAERAIDTLLAIGLRPTAPVEAKQFADPVARAKWREERHMLVFSLWDPNDPLHQVDLFVENPIEFEQLWARSLLVDLAGTMARIASIPDLIEMKKVAAGPQDMADVEALLAILDERR